MELSKKVLIWFSISDLDLSVLHEFLGNFENIEDLWKVEKYDGKNMPNITESEFRELIALRDKGLVDKFVAELESSSKIQYVCTNQENYPNKLRDLEYPPFVIYYVGDLSLVDSRCVGIVGSRVCTRYGREQTERFARELCQNGFVIVSGLSEGVDTVAHETTLNNNAKTIAVIPNGLKSIYPAINTNLARKIVKSGGLLLTEFYPDYEPKNTAFMRRNRITAGLCEGVLITEARRDSGALSTVDFAMDLNREVFALPGNCNSPTSAGTNDLIKGFGAICVTEPSEIINRLNEEKIYREIINQNQKPVSRVERTLNLKDEESQILEIVKNEDVHFDEIAKILNFNAKKLLGLLTMMEIRGLIRKLPGNFYIRKE